MSDDVQMTVTEVLEKSGVNRGKFEYLKKRFPDDFKSSGKVGRNILYGPEVLEAIKTRRGAIRKWNRQAK